MLELFKKLIVCLRQRSARPASAPTRRARPGLETLETREVLSASLSPLPGALPAPPLPHVESTGGLLGGIATPDAVYGYKHRPRIPRVLDAQGTTSEATAAVFLNLQGIVGQQYRDTSPVTLSAQSLAHQDEVFLHLASGGTEGPTVLSGNGLFVVHPPRGPVPAEALATAQ
jgi:hypothetical protein